MEVNAEILENSGFLSKNGFIGRRNYIVNLLIISIITVFPAIPLGKVIDLTNIWGSIKEAGVLYIFLLFLLVVLYSVPTAVNVKKRLSDITGKLYDDSALYAIFFIAAILQAVSYTNLILSSLIAITLFIFQILMCVLRGKFSSQISKSEINKFNWGAFFGTWIWGLMNKCYIPLLIIPLFFTPAWLSFILILGIKGNEWAYKKQHSKDIQQFHRSQKNQAIFWSIFTPIVSFLLSMLFVLMLMFLMVFIYEKPQEGSNEDAPTFMETLYENSIADDFKSYEYKDGEFKFYIDPLHWKEMKHAERVVLFDNAANYAKYKNTRLKAGIKESEVLSKTKIYSTYNNELLSEYKLDIPNEELNIKNILNGILNVYRINDNPTLP